MFKCFLNFQEFVNDLLEKTKTLWFKKALWWKVNINHKILSFESHICLYSIFYSCYHQTTKLKDCDSRTMEGTKNTGNNNNADKEQHAVAKVMTSSYSVRIRLGVVQL